MQHDGRYSDACHQSILDKGLEFCCLRVSLEVYLKIKLPGFEGLPAGDNVGDGCIVHKLLLQQRPALDLQIHILPVNVDQGRQSCSAARQAAACFESASRTMPS